MAAQNRTRKSTTAGQLATVASIQAPELEPTAELTPEATDHFHRIVKSREKDTWQPHDLSLATQLAKSMCRQDEINDTLDRDGLTLENRKGTPVAHPLLSASMTIASTVQALTRSLGLGASQRGLSGETQRSRSASETETRKQHQDKDDLLA